MLRFTEENKSKVAMRLRLRFQVKVEAKVNIKVNRKVCKSINLDKGIHRKCLY